jgi:hypothetical protein
VTVLRPRSKLVYFRVSEDEYQQLSALCERLGARSLSDLVRTSLLRLNMRGADEDGLESLAARIERLTRLVEELRQKLDEGPGVKVSRKL